MVIFKKGPSDQEGPGFDFQLDSAILGLKSKLNLHWMPFEM